MILLALLFPARISFCLPLEHQKRLATINTISRHIYLKRTLSLFPSAFSSFKSNRPITSPSKGSAFEELKGEWLLVHITYLRQLESTDSNDSRTTRNTTDRINPNYH